MRLALGIVLGVLLGLGGGALWYRGAGNDCFSRCGPSTKCVGGQCQVEASDTPATTTTKEKRRRKRKTAGGGSKNEPATVAAAPELHLKPGDEKQVAQGDSLGRTERVDFNSPGDDGKELQQEELDRVFGPAQNRINDCIADAIGDYPLDRGRVEVAFRVERTGAVKKLRVVGPALLQRQGLYKCVRDTVAELRFPSSGGASVVTYPFESADPARSS